jgi:hypothetical protein
VSPSRRYLEKICEAVIENWATFAGLGRAPTDSCDEVMPRAHSKMLINPLAMKFREDTRMLVSRA